MTEVEFICDAVAGFRGASGQGKADTGEVFIVSRFRDDERLDVGVSEMGKVTLGLGCRLAEEAKAAIVCAVRDDEAVRGFKLVVGRVVAPAVGDDAFVEFHVHHVQFWVR